MKNLAIPNDIKSPGRLASRRLFRWLVETSALALAYFLAARAGLILALENTNASPVWPASGIALAALLILGYRVWPGVMVGAVLANLLAFLQNQTAGFPVLVGISSCIGLGNTLQALLGAFLIHRFIGNQKIFESSRNTAKFFAIAFLACFPGSLIGSLTLSVTGLVPWSLYSTVWSTWWLGDTIGTLLLTPAFLALAKWYQEPVVFWEPRRLVEAVLLLGLLFAVCQIVFGEALPMKTPPHPLTFLVLPFLLWAAFRFGQGGVLLMVVVTSGMAIAGTLKGLGPFIQATQNESLLLLQTFMGTLTLTGLLVASILEERRRWEEALRQAQAGLEKHIEERTLELQTINESLKREIAERMRAEGEMRGAYRELQRSQEASLNIMEDLDRQKKELFKTNETLINEIAERRRSQAEREQLEFFAFLASHDLQEPLHKITAFGELLKKSAGPLDQKAKDCVERMQGAAERMSQLIEDLLNFTRTAARDAPFHTVSLKNVVEETVRDLELRIKETRARVKWGELPDVHGDAVQLRQLFQNLIANALKFCKPGEPPQVTLQSRNLDMGFVEITVRDNGVGFDESQVDRIFKPLERLHSQQEYRGSGMGLAICQRIVMRHGGKITAKSTLGKGSAFILTLPLER